ncbi:hypothetical protein P280DRAFT_454359 [Massarina eburnea CBS 473.64]|uniref:Bet v1-like protein n=1 Tax=Massarina eburnea CBS 473.64 TaxID=1395130 RepID=A0A6A6RXQ8_9PLEO|nr:hypothetical protein P280DRAFT_454359 [Massarina eburnea CBS 473.64]
MSNPTQSAIIWPSAFLPGTTDNFVTNEVIVSGLTAPQIWALLSDVSKWSTYYANVAQITPPSSGPHLRKGDVFSFSTFGLPVLTCPVEECFGPEKGKAGRIAWSAKLDGGEDEKVEVYHAWLVEDLEGGRVRILTQESQKGKPAKDLAGVKPNKMLLGHQDWLDGLVKKARGDVWDVKEGNLKAAGMDAY